MVTRHCIITKSTKRLKVSLYETIDLIPRDHWEQVAGNSNIYLSLSYLSGLEHALSNEIDFRYILFYDNDLEPVGVATIQLHRFTGSDFNLSKLSERIGDVLPNKVLEGMDVRLMICGNAFSTGENGFMFSESITTEEAETNLLEALERIRKEEDRSKDRISLFLLKDFWPDTSFNFEPIRSAGFRRIKIDPNMVVKLSPDWKTYEDYLNDMTTKFRTRLKGVAKKSDQITSRELSTTELELYQNRINELYDSVVDNAGIRFGTINAEAFEEFSRLLPDIYSLRGYFLDDELVGFGSSILNNGVLDANFVGIDYRFNVSHALYQLMLCDFVKRGIENKCSEVRLGRTAEQIKSCLGAEPVEMTLFIKHRNHFTNTLLKPLVENIKPSSFELRKPFKAAVYESWIQ